MFFLNQLKTVQPEHFMAPYNWLFFQSKKNIYFFYSFNLEPFDLEYQELFFEVQDLDCFKG